MKKNITMEPSYLSLYRQDKLPERIDRALALISPACRLCPRNCRVDRLTGKTGVCKTGAKAVVASYSPHFGEEAPLVGTHGSGTIFFSSCNLLCSFCQNFDISHQLVGRAVEPEELAAVMISLQKLDCHNINFVTPTHVVPQILQALPPAIEQGLEIPLVYNCGGYESVEALKLLEGIVDIYMPDFKFWDDSWAERFCRVRDYRERATQALREMHRQVGDLQINDAGLAVRGLLVRHLVMPDNIAGTLEVMTFLAREISLHTYVNVMGQYRPCGLAHQDDKINRRITASELAAAIKAALQAGLYRLDE
jgi:putative pyruvate formate lyase activating enzyme